MEASSEQLREIVTYPEWWPENAADRYGGDCSCCRWYHALEGARGGDWGVCFHPESERRGMLNFEHFGCEHIEGGVMSDEPRELLAEALPFVQEARDDEYDAAELYRHYPERRQKHMARALEIVALAERIKAAIPHGIDPEAVSASEKPDLSHPPPDTGQE